MAAVSRLAQQGCHPHHGSREQSSCCCGLGRKVLVTQLRLPAPPKQLLVLGPPAPAGQPPPCPCSRQQVAGLCLVLCQARSAAAELSQLPQFIFHLLPSRGLLTCQGRSAKPGTHPLLAGLEEAGPEVMKYSGLGTEQGRACSCSPHPHLASQAPGCCDGLRTTLLC